MKILENKFNPLKLNLQYFAEKPDEEKEENPEKSEETPEQSFEEKDEGDSGEEKKFSQADLDRIIKERLQREEKKREAALEKEREEQERKRKEEQGEYKELSESLQKELEELKAAALEANKKTLLTQAGYTEEQVERLSEYVKGESEDDIKQSVEKLKEDIPPKQHYVDPPLGNTERNKPTPTDKDEIGKKVFDRIKGKIF